MALISKIRKHSWIIVASLALALLGFLIMDVVRNNTFGGNTRYTVGKVNGETIDYNDFSRTEQTLYNNSQVDPFVRRNYLWNYFVEKSLLSKIADKLGLGVSDAEMDELQYGNNLSPIIAQRFMNPNTGQIDRDQLNKIKQALENNTLRADLVTYWNEQKNEIIKDRLQNKYTSLVNGAIYAPSWQAELRNSESNELLDFQFVKLPFDLVKDSIAISDNEIANYISSHRAQYDYPEEARFVEYASFKVSPTSDDSTAVFKDVQSLIDSFKTTTNDTAFLAQNESKLDEAFVSKSALSPTVADALYGLAKGAVYGPYIDNGHYVIAKMMNRKVVPDSVEVRHILRNVQTPDQLASAQRTIDSLKTLLESGKAKFDSLAIRFSQDPGSGFNGGKLGVNAPGVMVKPFNDVMFYKAVPGKYYSVTTQFGVHLIEVTKQIFKKADKKDPKSSTAKEQVQLAYIAKPIIPSQETQNKIEDQVNSIIQANRTLADLKKALSNRNDVSFEKSGPVKANDATVGQLASSQATRDLVRWAFDSKTNIGDASPEMFTYEDNVNFYTNQIVLAGLKSIQPKGLATVDAVRDEVSQILTNKKKGEKLISQLGDAKDIYALSTKYSIKVDTASNVNFSTSFLPSMGNEPKVVAAAFGTEKNSTSKPIIGNGGVYVVKTTGRTPSVGSNDLNFFREQATSLSKNNIKSFFMESIKKNANIKDNRSNFF